jgi:solute carrier family 66 (lysosomal lysine-arginine transporter), member 1
MEATNVTTTSPPIAGGCVCVPATIHGDPYSLFIAHVFSDCVYTTRDYTGFTIGLTSLAFWLCAQAPQFMKNCRAGKASALSIWFLAEWMLGDSLNLISCLMTGQLSTVTITSILFVSMDFCLLFQYLYLETSCCNAKDDRDGAGDGYDAVLLEENQSNDGGKGHQRHSSDPLLQGSGGDASLDYFTDGKKSGSNGRALHAFFLPIVFLFGATTLLGANGMLGAPGASFSSRLGRKLLSAADEGLPEVQGSVFFGRHGPVPARRPKECNVGPDTSSAVEELGVIFGWVSACIYLTSRVPQILKNIKRGSVEGLSPIMFFCAVMGNSTYACGIFLRAVNWDAIVKALPYLVGSVGTLMFDFTILMQFFYFQGRRPNRPGHLDDSLLSNARQEGENPKPGNERNEAARGLHNIVRWDASPWLTPEQIKLARKNSNKY